MDQHNGLVLPFVRAYGLQRCRIFEVPEADLAAMQRSGSSEAKLHGWVLRLRGLPYTATAADVVGFFDGLELARGSAGVVFTCTSDGRPLGEAYVEFTSEEAQQAAHVLSIGLSCFR